MNFDSNRVPKEIHQKETIAIHIPKINRPLTYRQLYFIMPGLLLSFIIQLVWAILLKIPSNVGDKIFDIVLRIMIFLFIPVLFGIVSTFKKKGKYLEEIMLRKISYSKNSTVVLNEKALRAINNKNNQ